MIAHGESRDQRLSQAVELALSQAQADWLKNEEEIRQREIDQAVEVAVTNAVAEAKVEWEKEVMAQVSTQKFSFEKWPNYFRKISVKASYRIASTLNSSEILTNAHDYFRALTTVHEHSKTPKALSVRK